MAQGEGEKDLTERMRRSAKGDALAFEQLYRRLFPVVTNFVASRQTWQFRGASEDITQEVFCRLWQSRTKFNGQSTVTTYAIGIAINVIREQRQVKPMAASISTEQQTVLPTDPLTRQEESETLLAMIADLSPKQREAIELVHLKGLSPEQAATKADCCEDVLRWRLADARKVLNKLMGKLSNRQKNNTNRV